MHTYALSVCCCLFLLHLTAGNVQFTAISEGRTSKVVIPECSEEPCDGPLAPIYCHGRILSLSWYFAGMAQNCTGSGLLHSIDQVMKEFEKLPEIPTREQFSQFCERNFDHGEVLDVVEPSDWTPKQPQFEQIKDPIYRELAQNLHERWKMLTRRVKPHVAFHPQMYPLITVPHNFVVPGGHFQIYFYWDTYWIIKGLLYSGMTETVAGMLRNFAHLIRHLGYIPNAGTLVLSKRSQPPLFVQMVADYYEETKDQQLLEELMPAMDLEMEWWHKERSSRIRFNSHDSTVFQYRVAMDCPRPESYSTDIQDAEKSTYDPRFVWSSVNSACESGWDFSSRWFSWDNGTGPGTKSHIKTKHIVPVDLNAFMCKNYAILAKLWKQLGNKSKAAHYAHLHTEMTQTLDSIFWNEAAGAWFDVDKNSSTHRERFFASNLIPLYAPECVQDADGKYAKILKYLKDTGVLEFPGGIPTSLQKSGHQWDFPDAWPPLVHLLIEGFRKSNSPEMQGIALNLTDRWIAMNYRGFVRSGELQAMWEKYDVRFVDGKPGDGGEYPVQNGFGWTNGVALDLLRTYGSVLRAPADIVASSNDEDMKEGVERTFTGWKIAFGMAFISICISYVSVRYQRRRRPQLLPDAPKVVSRGKMKQG